MTKLCGWLVLLGALPTAVVASEGVVRRHAPSQSGGWASDTNYPAYGMMGNSQRLTDDFLLEADATIRQIAWWGHYGLASPPADETMRIRFYLPDPVGGLPGDLVAELAVANPQREATGMLVSASPGETGLYPEYRFQAILSSPVSLVADTPYWIEIAESGGPLSLFVWEFATADQNGFAYANPEVSPWQRTVLGCDLAFELSTVPEPGTICLVMLGVALARRRRLR